MDPAAAMNRLSAQGGRRTAGVFDQTEGDKVMTADEIRSQRFAVQLGRGFRRDEVVAFLQDVADAYEDLELTNASLVDQVKTLEAELQSGAVGTVPAAQSGQRLSDTDEPSGPLTSRREREAAPGQIGGLRAAVLREVEALLHDAQAQVHTIIAGAEEQKAALLREVETAKAEVRAEADGLLAEARATADALVADAKNQEATIRAEIERLVQSRVQLVDEISGKLDAYHQWLASIDPRRRRAG
jgi:DivIVA domain-containing protein